MTTTTEAALRDALKDIAKGVFIDAATQTHYSWIDGTNGREPDFGEAASDYAESFADAYVEQIAALSQPSPASSTAGELRPLRWYKPSDHPCDREDALWMAMGYGGRYAIQEDGGYFIVWMADDEFTFEQGDSVDACKEIAERHWQEQIGRLRLSPSSGEPAPNTGNIMIDGEEYVPIEAYREAMSGWKSANQRSRESASSTVWLGADDLAYLTRIFQEYTDPNFDAEQRINAWFASLSPSSGEPAPAAVEAEQFARQFIDGLRGRVLMSNREMVIQELAAALSQSPASSTAVEVDWTDERMIYLRESAEEMLDHQLNYTDPVFMFGQACVNYGFSLSPSSGEPASVAGEECDGSCGMLDCHTHEPASVAGEADGWRHRLRQRKEHGFGEWSEWRDGKAGSFSSRFVEVEDCPLYAHPPLSKPTPVEAGALERLTQVASGCMLEAVYGKEWCAFPEVEFRKDMRAILAALATPPSKEGEEG